MGLSSEYICLPLVERPMEMLNSGSRMHVDTGQCDDPLSLQFPAWKVQGFFDVVYAGPTTMSDVEHLFLKRFSSVSPQFVYNGKNGREKSRIHAKPSENM